MNKYSLIWAFIFLLVSCKEDRPAINVGDQTPTETGGTVEESLEVKLVRNTTLIKKVVSFNEAQLADGVKEARLEYLNQHSQPMALFFFKVDLNNKDIQLKPLTPNGEKRYAMQSIPDMVKVNTFSGYKIVGAVNSDFFNTSTGEPRSIVILNKQAVRTTLPTIRSYFGINESGAPIIGDYSVFSTQQTTIVDALGGYHRLIKQNFPIAQTDLSVHPRTAVGFTANKIVYFLVADGRNPSYSNGLTLADVTAIMKALEVKEAINLDGGGSSTFVVNKTQISVSNQPSDGSPRKVANGWAICTKHSQK
ncbi:phosphodiester glycosidase family protein [Pedobacter nanyangensis]|uniref:phosphodiester glycosidase family protein n=1 Tax=Pedobacter nanyangensis TaxID=1562389 RepID=UPI000DE2BC30|nr:phosphodiester glycosidase family protein [Pedobacter nanyangensis]